MNVRLISMTQPVSTGSNIGTIGADITLNEMNQESLLAYCARVSNPKNQNNHATADKLLKYCANNKHWSVFEMADMTVEITTSRFIAQQILRHRSFSFQEFSQRYAEATEFETYPARRQDEKNRQNSIDDMSDGVKRWFEQEQKGIQDLCALRYQEALKKGIAKEQARFLLPGSVQTKLYMKGSVRSWIHYLSVRTDKATQLEHREIALKCQAILLEQFPSLSEVLENVDS